MNAHAAKFYPLISCDMLLMYKHTLRAQPYKVYDTFGMYMLFRINNRGGGGKGLFLYNNSIIHFKLALRKMSV